MEGRHLRSRYAYRLHSVSGYLYRSSKLHGRQVSSNPYPHVFSQILALVHLLQVAPARLDDRPGALESAFDDVATLLDTVDDCNLVEAEALSLTTMHLVIAVREAAQTRLTRCVGCVYVTVSNKLRGECCYTYGGTTHVL